MKIQIDPPTSDARRDRVERQLFAQLAAVRIADRAETVIPRPRRNRSVYAFAFAGLAAAAFAVVMLVGRDDGGPNLIATTPSRIVTPVGGESRYVIVDTATIDAKSDTSVEVQHVPGGATTLVLTRGTIDCEVEPRGSRPPFVVKAGDLTVEVVGTRFTVSRSPARVDVAHGTVRVTAPGGTWLVEAGESWPPTQTAQATPPPAPAPAVVEPEPIAEPAAPTAAPSHAPVAKKHAHTDEPAPAPGPVTKAKPEASPRDLAKESLKIAQQKEANDPKGAAQLYRAIATSNEALAPSALIALAVLQLKRDPAEALAAAEEHIQRFPKAASAQEALWHRYNALLALGKRDEARGAAADYLRQFPNGTFADRFPTR